MKITWTDKKIIIDGEGLGLTYRGGDPPPLSIPGTDPTPFPLEVSNFKITKL